MTSQAGPSRSSQSQITVNGSPHTVDMALTREIPSTGLEYWEYRRACFLAGVEWPGPSSSTTTVTTPTTRTHHQLPRTYTVSSTYPPPAIPDVPTPALVPGSSIARLQVLLNDFSQSDPRQAEIVWNGGLNRVSRNLIGGKSFSPGIRLGLVIKILKAGWIKDGTWPVDPITFRAVLPPPDSPTSSTAPESAADVPPLLGMPTLSLANESTFLSTALGVGVGVTSDPTTPPHPRQILPIPRRAGELIPIRSTSVPLPPASSAVTVGAPRAADTCSSNR